MLSEYTKEYFVNKKERYLILIMLFITCAITLLYGKNRVQVVQGEKNPDIVKNINNNITMQYTQSSIEYFSNEVQSLSQIEEESEVIIKAKILENRVMSARSTKTQVLIEEILKELEQFYPTLWDGSFLEESRKRSILLGKEILVIDSSSPGGAYSAKAVDLDEFGHLLIEREGKPEILNSGEVSIRFLGK